VGFLEDPPRAFRALRHQQFRVVWGTFVVGQLGFWVSFVSFQALMSRLTDADGTWLGLLFFTQFIPTLVFTPFAGVIADRVERKRILMTGYIVLALTVGTLAVLTLTEHIRPVTMLPFAFVMGIVFAFNAPASQALVAGSVVRDDLPSAISLNSTGANLSRVVGPTIAAPLLTIWNEGAAFVVYAVTSVIVFFLLRRAQLHDYEREVGISKFSEWLRSGWVHARQRPPAMRALSILAMSSLFAGAYLAVLPIVAAKVFDKGPAGFSLLAAMAGVGSVAGAFLTGLRLKVPTLRSVGFLVAGFGASVSIFASAPTWTWALVLVIPVGLLYFSAMTTINTLLQFLADDARRGRMLSLFQVGWAGLVPVGGLWLGIVAAAQGARFALGLAGVVTATYALIAVAMSGSTATQRAGAWETVL
jgi:MFS family permease